MYGAKAICKFLKISESGYYRWLRNQGKPGARQLLLVKIQGIFSEHPDNKNYGVNIVNKDNSELKVFESVIDCMSYIDIYHDTTSNKLILGMVEDNPIEQFLRDYDHIKKITFCLDNDAAGQKAIYGDENAVSERRKQGMYRRYQERGYEVSVKIPASGKDFNEALLNMKNASLPHEDTRSEKVASYAASGR